MHLFPQLRKIGQKYRDRVIVIGVHSPKFPAERETANLREAVLRYRIEHPVVNDRDFAAWQLYGGRAWPTLMFIDPEGRVIGKHEGELPFAEFDPLVAGMLTEFAERGLLKAGQAALSLEEIREPERTLRFPGKVLATRSALYVADTNHHRVLECDLDGGLRRTIGSGEPGLTDAPGNETGFQQPQGMVIDGEVLYIADTENHAIRAVDLESGAVRTVAGTGEQGTALAALADAGLLDGSLATAWFAQSSGLAQMDGQLYLADSEVSAVRDIDLGSGTVSTIVGEGPLCVWGRGRRRRCGPVAASARDYRSRGHAVRGR